MLAKQENKDGEKQVLTTSGQNSFNMGLRMKRDLQENIMVRTCRIKAKCHYVFHLSTLAGCPKKASVLYLPLQSTLPLGNGSAIWPRFLASFFQGSARAQ